MIRTQGIVNYLRRCWRKPWSLTTGVDILWNATQATHAPPQPGAAFPIWWREPRTHFHASNSQNNASIPWNSLVFLAISSLNRSSLSLKTPKCSAKPQTLKSLWLLLSKYQNMEFLRRGWAKMANATLFTTLAAFHKTRWTWPKVGFYWLTEHGSNFLPWYSFCFHQTMEMTRNENSHFFASSLWDLC